MRTRRGAPVVLGAVAFGVCCGVARPARSDDFRHAWRTSPRLIGLGVAVTPNLANAVDVALEQAARNLPIPSASAGFTYRIDPNGGPPEPSSTTFAAPFFTERAETVGEHVVSVDVATQWLDVDQYDGRALGRDPFPLSVSEASIGFSAKPELRYTVATVNVTYGMADDVDVNVAIPVAGLDAGVVARRLTPSGSTAAAASSDSFDTVGLADMLVRVKRRLFDTGGFTGAIGGVARIPTGSPKDGLGTGYGELGAYGVLSTEFLHGLLDSHWEAGFDANVGVASHSSAHYAWAADLQASRRVSLGAEIRGRSEIADWASTSSVSGPHVTPQGIRSLPYLGIDATLGIRVRVWGTALLSAGVSTPLNDAGVRASGWSPVAAFEVTF